MGKSKRVFRSYPSTKEEEFASREERDRRWRQLKKAGKKCHKSTGQVLIDGAWRMVWVVLYSN